MNRQANQHLAERLGTSNIIVDEGALQRGFELPQGEEVDCLALRQIAASRAARERQRMAAQRPEQAEDIRERRNRRSKHWGVAATYLRSKPQGFAELSAPKQHFKVFQRNGVEVYETVNRSAEWEADRLDMIERENLGRSASRAKLLTTGDRTA